MTDVLLSLAESVAFAHAAVQVIAEDHDIDLLHIKGPAIDHSLQRIPGAGDASTIRLSADADVLVRPEHVTRLSEALSRHGWRRHFDFDDGSPFGHAATWGHDRVGFLDVHRFFPGIELDPPTAFETLWQDRGRQAIAGITCDVPALTAQRLIMIVHAARGRGLRDRSDIDVAWTAVTEVDRQAVEALAEKLDARVALYAGTGRLAELQDAHSYPLWRELTHPSPSLLSMWWARVRAEPDMLSGARKGVHLILPNTHRMETWLGRPPTRREVASAYVDRLRLGVRAVRAAVKKRDAL